MADEQRRPPYERDQEMAAQDRENLTALINQARAGSTDARSKLLEAVYGEFHRIADGLMRSERPGTHASAERLGE